MRTHHASIGREHAHVELDAHRKPELLSIGWWEAERRDDARKKAGSKAGFLACTGGRYWDRTSDPCRVKAVLYR